jgi:hypothetical protein
LDEDHATDAAVIAELTRLADQTVAAQIVNCPTAAPSRIHRNDV